MSARLLLAGKLAAAGLMVAAGLALLRVHSDRQYINLAPTEGAIHGVVLQPEKTYEQTFIATRPSLTRLGVFLRSASGANHHESVIVRLWRGDVLLGERTVPIAFIDNQDATQVRFEPLVPTVVGEELKFAVSVPPALAGQVRIQERERDESFSATDAVFLIDGQPQTNPLAYQAFYDYRSPFSAQLGVLVMVAALLLLAWPARRRYQKWLIVAYLLVMSLLAVIPRLFIAPFPWLLFGTGLLSAASMYWLARQRGMGVLAALLAAQVFALTSWWPLHLLADWRSLQLVVAEPASLRDVFLDTYQVASSVKVPGGASWDHYGSYIGVIGMTLALVGLATDGRRQWPVVAVGAFGLAAATLWPMMPHAIILATFALAVFAGWGLQRLGEYLAAYGRLATVILAALFLLCLLDLLYVLAGPLEYGILAQEQIWKT